MRGQSLYWFNNNFSNLTRAILFPGASGGSADHYVAPMHGVPSPSAGGMNHPEGANHYAPSRDYDPGHSRADAEEYAAMQRAALQRRGRDFDRGSYDDLPERESPARDNPVPQRPKSSKDPERPIPEIFKKVPLFPMGKKPEEKK